MRASWLLASIEGQGGGGGGYIIHPVIVAIFSCVHITSNTVILAYFQALY
jgi:hypothetical protein